MRKRATRGVRGPPVGRRPLRRSRASKTAKLVHGIQRAALRVTGRAQAAPFGAGAIADELFGTGGGESVIAACLNA